MNQFNKITIGFVVQVFRRGDKNRFVCIEQEFVAGDQCECEDAHGNPVELPEHAYQPYTMMPVNDETIGKAPELGKVYQAIEEVLESLDVGGEQPHQFAQEIATLRDTLHLPAVDRAPQAHGCRTMAQELRSLAMKAEGLTASLPVLPVDKWLDGTVANSTADVEFRDCDLAGLLQFIADVGVSRDN